MQQTLKSVPIDASTAEPALQRVSTPQAWYGPANVASTVGQYASPLAF